MPTRRKGPNVRSAQRKNKIRDEVYEILRHEAHKIFVAKNLSEDGLAKRINALESAGVPQSELDFIKTAISQIRYKQYQMQKAMEGLLQFFNVTKQFFEDKP